MSAFQNACGKRGLSEYLYSTASRGILSRCPACFHLPADSFFLLTCRCLWLLALSQVVSDRKHVTYSFRSGVGKASVWSLGSTGPGPSTASGLPGRSGQTVPEPVAEASDIKRDTAITPSKAPAESIREVTAFGLWLTGCFCFAHTLFSKCAFLPSSSQPSTRALPFALIGHMHWGEVWWTETEKWWRSYSTCEYDQGFQ